jgi:hypothetical protein
MTNKEFIRKIGIGPMSSEVIEAAYKYSASNNKELMLIASKNQIDYKSGYVNNWSTKDYCNFLKNLKKKYDGKVKICRDHCGPGFNNNYSLKDVYRTIDSDIENGFDLIHIDFSKSKSNYKKILENSKRAILYAKSLSSKLQIEVGTDENFGQRLSHMNIKEFISEINFFLDFINPEYFVVPTGSLIMEDKQIGFYNENFIKSIYKRLSPKKINLKEHNADYLSGEEISIRKKYISGLNIAPQFGVNQTMFVLNECKKFGVNPDNFLEVSYSSKKWEKWLYKINRNDKLRCSIIAGHYNFNTKEYKILIENLQKYKKNINNDIINSHIEIIDHYVTNFY